MQTSHTLEHLRRWPLQQQGVWDSDICRPEDALMFMNFGDGNLDNAAPPALTDRMKETRWLIKEFCAKKYASDALASCMITPHELC